MSADKSPDQTPIHTDNPDTYSTEAKALIQSQRAMVLATSSGTEPWTAPVYYVHIKPGFYFFSSPKSRHIEEGLAPATVSAAIFADSDQWEKIQGLQMSGTIKSVTKKSEQLKVVARFLLKFPFARPFLQSDRPNKDQPQVGDRVRLYVFEPQQAFYLNNRLGFGRRLPVSL